MIDRAHQRRGLLALALLAAIAVTVPPGAAWAIDPTAQQDAQKQQQGQQPGVQKQAEPTPRLWSVWGIFETHWLAIRDNLASDDVYHQFYLYANFDPPRFWKIPPLGRFSLRLEATQRYIADPGESGFLFGDVRLYYSHPFSFSIKDQKFSGRGYFYWTFPTSKISQKEGNIARPTLLGVLAKAFPKGFEVLLRPFARINWAQYAESTGGSPNQKWILGYDLWLVWNLPWHKRLTVGGIWAQDWFNKYAARDGGSQPWTWEYAWELFAGYSLLTKEARQHVDLDLALSLASGRKVVDDGVFRFRLFDRRETELYLTIRAMY